MFAVKKLVSNKLRECLWDAARNDKSLFLKSTIQKSATGLIAKSLVHSKMSGKSDSSQHLIWVDMEMTGLNPETDKIMEVAVIITDKSLNTVGQPKHLIINVNDEELSKMGDWCKKTHGGTGLTAACKTSKVTIEEADKTLTNFVQQYTPPNACPLAGNSVSYDRAFMKRFLPKLNNHIHYRIVDVSTIKEIIRRWNPEIYNATPKKKLTHQALDDILESIAELKYYKDTVFRPSSGDA